MAGWAQWSFGGLAEERISSTIHSLVGERANYSHLGASDHLATIRQLLSTANRRRQSSLR